VCGICGIVAHEPDARVDEHLLVRMRDTMVARGPDDAGAVTEGRWGLGHRRLSILDVSARARQPMDSASRRYCLTYNGEIYNFQALREELRGRGQRFRSDGDTEVLVEAIDAWGLDETVRRLDGIFAFAVWDRREQRLLGARDPFGVKPFYYAVTSEAFLFASSIRALWVAGLERQIDPEVLEELLVFRYVAGERTPFLGVQELPPGHTLELSGATVRLRSSWSPFDHVGGDPVAGTAWVERFQHAVRAQRVSDVPLGTFLSGGLDSSTLTAELAESQNEPLDTFTVSLPESEGTDEWPHAEAVASRHGCRPHRLQIPADRVLDRLREAQRQHDEPLAHGNDLYLYELSVLAKHHVTVLLSGEGADETLGGYVRYQPVRWPALWRLGASAPLAPLRALLGARGGRAGRTLQRMLEFESLQDVLLYNAADVLPADLRRIGYPVNAGYEARRDMLEQAARATSEPLRQLMLYDLQTFLRSLLNRNDRMTMGASIECRVPFLAIEVVEAALGLPTRALFEGRIGKRVLRQHARDRVPPAILERPKWGLGIPWARYLREDPACRAIVESLPRSEIGRALGAGGFEAAVREFLAGRDAVTPLVYQVFSLAIWWEQVVEAPLEQDFETTRVAEASS